MEGMVEPGLERASEFNPLVRGGVKILTAKTAGICFGVERALNLSEKALKEASQPISSLGPLIHNPQAVGELASRGLKVSQKLEDIQGTVVFRSHGVTLQTQALASKLGLSVVDATCPLVKVPQNFARRLSEAGYFVVIIGDRNHPEIQGVMSYVENGHFCVVKGPEELDAIGKHDRVGVICQTTLKRSVFDSVVARCKELFSEVKSHNTICSATKDRQEAAYELASQVDCMIVIGGRNSSNTQKLYDICSDLCPKAHLIETAGELKAEWFQGLKSIGITAGASTPHAVIESVRQTVATLVS
ncbi:MAG: 4-hydroxy-3-methylbut-2-enyl diphosphate reductase [Oligoflexia bacterium]|nr:4-hydroxy-3-methylbut-2-enyl diphosphate reductase [Oligoflexia bacterium]